MTTVLLCPTFGAGYQGFDHSGAPLFGGFIHTYIAGGTTPQATYTTVAGSVQNANPIQLGADGRPPNEIWLIAGLSYRFDVTDALGNIMASYDNLSGSFDSYSLSASGGSALVGDVSPGTNPQTGTVNSRLASIAYSGEVTLIRTGPSTWDVYNEYRNPVTIVGSTTQGLQEAINYAAANGLGIVVRGGQTSKNPGGVDYGIINCTSGIVWPPLRCARIVFDGVHIVFSAAVTGDGMLFDSMQAVDFSLCGEITYQGNAAALAIVPTNAIPVDTTTGVGAGRFYLQSIACVGGTPVACVRCDPAAGSIIGWHAEFEELNGSGAVGSPALAQFGLEVSLSSASWGWYYNTIRIGNAHHVTGAGIQEGISALHQANAVGNTYDIGMLLPKGAASSGINTFGQRGNYRVGSINNGLGAVLNGLVFEPGANSNTAFIADLSGPTNPITDSGSGNVVRYNGFEYWNATKRISPNIGGAYTLVTNAAGITWTAAQMAGGILERIGPIGPVNDVTDTAANIVATYPNAVSGAFYRMKIYNNSAAAITLTAGAGVTVKGWAAIASNTSRDFIVQITNVGAGTEAATVYG